jgi:hypothetical protein
LRDNKNVDEDTARVDRADLLAHAVVRLEKFLRSNRVEVRLPAGQTLDYLPHHTEPAELMNKIKELAANKKTAPVGAVEAAAAMQKVADAGLLDETLTLVTAYHKYFQKRKLVVPPLNATDIITVMVRGLVMARNFRHVFRSDSIFFKESNFVEGQS